MFTNTESDQAKRTNLKVKELLAVRTLVKAVVQAIPDYQLRAWCRVTDKDLATDITLDWLKHKEELHVDDKVLVVKNWQEVLLITTREVKTLVTNYGK